jgi:peptidoglycan/xylan/chitin deacetylase (PgdA/CDA1 family)
MRYAQLSVGKVIFLTGFLVALFMITVSTFLWKGAVYGATPFFNAVGIFFQERALYSAFAVQHFSARAVAAITAFTTQADANDEPRFAQAIPVLTYHRLSGKTDNANVTIPNFMDQMQALYDHGWHTITLQEYEEFMRGERTLPEKSFLITFDDGAQQSFYPTDPIFKLLGYSAVQYVIVEPTKLVGSTYYLSETQVRNMLATGRWEIGSHSYDAHHPYPADAQGGEGIFYSDKLWVPELGRLETDEEFRARVRTDLVESKKALEATYGVPIRTFAFPFGGEAALKGAHNYPEGESVTIDEASKVYDIGWIQTEMQEYTFNYPINFSFLNQRIHVDHDWGGARLLQIMENGLPKDLPFTDDMKKDTGWLQSWGDVLTGEILVLRAQTGETSASTILDGTRLWENYEIESEATWQTGSAFLLAQAIDAKTYRSCAFSNGEVQVQDTRGDSSQPIARASNQLVRFGDAVRLGMRVSGGTITCLYNGVEVVSAQTDMRSGGIGFQIWDQSPGQAELTIHKISVVAR